MGFFEDMFDTGQSFLAFVIGIVIVLIILDGLVSNFNSSSIATPESIEAVTSLKNQAYSGFDIAFLVLAIGLIVVSSLVSFFNAKDPIWFIGIIFGLIAILFLFVVVGAIYDRFIIVSSVSIVIAQLVYIPYIMAHLLEYAIIFATATSISLFTGKGRT